MKQRYPVLAESTLWPLFSFSRAFCQRAALIQKGLFHFAETALTDADCCTWEENVQLHLSEKCQSSSI